jgi:ubiquitin-protein ligase E3 C
MLRCSLEEQQLSKPDDPLQGPRHLSKRQLAAMSPRLGILNNIPFAIPFEVRVSIFRHFVLNDMAGRGTLRHRGFGPFGHKARVQVRRGMVAQDGFDRLGEVDLKAPIEITFIDQFGQEECVFLLWLWFFG